MAEKDEFGRDGFGIGGANGFRFGIPQLERRKDVKRGKGDDKRRQTQARHQQAVDVAHDTTGNHPDYEGEFCGHARFDRKFAHDDRGQNHDCADRQVDTGGQDDDGLCNRDDAGDGDLLQDQRQVVGRHEPLARRETKHQHAEGKHADRNGGGIGVQKRAQLLQKGHIGPVKGRYLGVGLGKL